MKLLVLIISIQFSWYTETKVQQQDTILEASIVCAKYYAGGNCSCDLYEIDVSIPSIRKLKKIDVDELTGIAAPRKEEMKP